MPKGGRRTRSGPAPDPNALARERDEGEWTVLPPTGRPGRAPAWPLHPPATARERKVWTELWKRPQAIMWERLCQEFYVGLYVRRLVEAEERGSAVNLSTLVRQMADSLGVTTPGLHSNRWKIEREKTAGPEQQSTGAGRSRSRARLQVVGSDVGA
jgi:hypothetical protein